MSLGLIFLVALVVFVLIIMFFSWYTKFVAHKIFGRVNETLNSIIENGVVPAAWDKRLISKMKTANTPEQKEEALNKHIRYLEGEFKNLKEFAEKSSFIGDDKDRQEVVDAL